MRQTQLFTKTRREAPSDETSKNAQLLIRAGYINKEMAGVYDYLPLGLLVLKKIENIIREEMNALDAQEVLMSTLQRKELWERTDRWSDDNIDVWFKSQLKDGNIVGLGFTHEEPISNMLEQFVSSYKNLPFSVYQFQNKFRNEIRSKSGIMRTREFIMKDAYTFCKDEKEHQDIYNKFTEAYKNIFNRVGIGDKTYVTYASGGSFSKFSHEFQTITESGEDIIYVHKDDFGKGVNMDPGHAAINKEIFTEDLKKELGLVGDFEEKKAVEVGNIFTLGTKFSDPYLVYTDESGNKHPVFMGCYGIGLGRLMGTVVEVLSDDKGIIWPEAVAPFKYHLVEIVSSKPEVREMAEKVYQTLGVENVLYDDRDLRAGEKFADSDLLGMPFQIVVSEKTVAQDKVELKDRKTGETKLVDPNTLK